MPDELASLPTLSPSLSYLWEYFLQLHRTRAGNGFGPVPLQYVDIQAWCALTKQKLDHWELNALLDVDAVFLEVTAKNSKKGGSSD